MHIVAVLVIVCVVEWDSGTEMREKGLEGSGSCDKIDLARWLILHLQIQKEATVSGPMARRVKRISEAISSVSLSVSVHRFDSDFNHTDVVSVLTRKQNRSITKNGGCFFNNGMHIGISSNQPNRVITFGLKAYQ